MKRRLLNYVLIFTAVILIGISRVNADTIVNPGTGGGTGAGAWGSGDWYPAYVGVRLSIVSSSGTNIESKIMINRSDLSSYFSTSTTSKINNPSNIRWNNSVSTALASSDLPANWQSGGGTINFESYLSENNYAHLKNLLAKMNTRNFDGTEYLIVEPMVRIKNYFGTAYEFGLEFPGNTYCANSILSTPGTFYYSYASLFASENCLFCNTIFLKETYFNNNPRFGMSYSGYLRNSGLWEYRCNAVVSRSGSLGIGIYKINSLVTINPKCEYKNGKYYDKNGNIVSKPVYESQCLGKKYSLTINKVDSSGKRIDSYAQFKISKCANDACTSSTSVYNGKFMGSYTKPNLEPGLYKVEEVTAPTGYVKDSNSHLVRIVSSNQTINIENKSICEYDFDRLTNKNSLTDRMALYEKHGYRNLLNTNIKDATGACSNPNCNPNKVKKIGCLSASFENNSFGIDDLSCYTSKITYGGKTGYCNTNYELGNIFESNNYSYTDSVVFPTVKSGQAIFSSTNRTIAKGTLTRICYIPSNINSNSITPKLTDDYVKNVSFAKDSESILDENKKQSVASNLVLGNGIVLRTETMETEYKLPRYFIDVTSGRIYDNIRDCKNCSVLNYYGVFSKLTDNTNGNLVNFNFSLTVDGKDYTNNTCKYKIDPQIISPKCQQVGGVYYGIDGRVVSKSQFGKECQNAQKNDLNLEFRIIDTTNSFPAIDGNGRMVGENWCSGNGFLKIKTNEAGDDDLISRATFAHWIATAFEVKAIGTYNPFPDVSGDESNIYYTKYYNDIIALSSHGYMNGDDDGKFRPNDPIKRVEAIAVMYRILTEGGPYEAPILRHNNTLGSVTVSDIGGLATWGKDAVQWAANNYIIRGATSGSSVASEPERYAKKEEVYTMIKRAIQDCYNDNQKVTEYINDANNSYNIRNEEPRFRILLDAKTMLAIKKYNKSHSYNDYEQTYTNQMYINRFLNKLSRGSLDSDKVNALEISWDNNWSLQ